MKLKGRNLLVVLNCTFMEDEIEFTNWIADYVDTELNVLGHREDAVAIKFGNEYMVLNTDGWVESTDRPPGISLQDCGYRAVINAASDLVAKGAKPEAMIISLSIPRERKSEIKEIVNGIVSASKEHKIAYLGGDVNTSLDLVIDVTIWGKTERLIKRSSANVGDKICWIGPPLGSTAAALGVLLNNWIGDEKKAIITMGKPHLYPQFLTTPATSAIDCSDGLARSIHLLVESSGKGAIIEPQRIVEPWIVNVSQQNGINEDHLIFYGGEELGIVFTIAQKETIPKDAIILGNIVEERNIVYKGEYLVNQGWDHFLKSE